MKNQGRKKVSALNRKVIIKNNLSLLAAITILLLCSSSVVFAQDAHITENTKNTSDQVLRSNARVNPSTLAMELSIPIADFPGRAGMGMPLVFNYSSKLWRLELSGYGETQTVNFTSNIARYSEKSASGWTSSFGTAQIEAYEDLYDCHGNPLGEAENHVPPRPGGIEPPPGYCGEGVYYITRLRVKLPDGSTTELRKDDVIYERTQTAIDWTGTYLATDGSRSRLEMGETSSVLYLPDGSRYYFQIPSGGTEQIGYMYEDRHGNRLNFNVSTRTWTDTLGRSLTSPIPLNFGEPEQTAGTQNFTIPGLTGTSARQYSLVWKNLGDTGVLLDSNEALAYYGNSINCPYDNTETNALFFGGLETRICRSGIFNPVVLTEIVLPNQQKYKFWYNKYGEITKIEYPTGAYERFAYGEVPTLARRRDITHDQMNRGVVDRWVRESSAASELHWQYDAYKESNGVQNESRLRIRTTAPDGVTSTDQYVETNWSNGMPQERTKYGFENPLAGRPYEERLYSGTTLKSRKLTEYEYTGAIGTGAFDWATRDPRAKREISVIFEPGSTNALVTMTVNTYDTSGSTDLRAFSSLNLKTTSQYGFIAVEKNAAADETVSQLALRFNNSTPVVRTETDYSYGNTNYLDVDRSLLAMVTDQRTVNPANNNEVVARTQMRYDEYDFETSGFLPSFASATWASPVNGNYRGNVTSIRSYTSIAGNEYIETHSYFDQYGNVRKSVDANGNISQLEYNASDYACAYPTKTISPVPGGNGSTTAFETTSTYDYNTGLQLSGTDANGLVIRMEYNDPLLRPTKVKPTYNNMTVGAETITQYGAGTSDSTRFVKVKTQVDETNWKEGYTWYDGLGRTIRTQSVDPADGDVFTLTCYDTMGRIKKVTNPFRNFTNQICSTTTGLEWTTTDYDNFGRVWKMKTPDNAEVETSYSLVTTGSLYGTVVTVEDQAGKLRRSVTNAFNQLKRVDEPNNSNQLGAIDNPNQYTSYSYDLLNNLTMVNQGSQTRSFVYDSISRLKEVTNPESGTITYTYDPNGNVKTKRDSRDIKIIYDYDSLNRVIKRCYRVLNSSSLGMTTCAGNSETPEPNTPDATYTYDDANVSNSKGKLTKVITGDTSNPFSKTEYTEFDIMGRIKKSKQTTDATTYNEMEYMYNLSGALIEQKYPSGRVVKNLLDNSGDLSIVQSKKNQSAGFWNYAQHFTYTAAGDVASMQLGNGRWESTVYNSRLQPEQIALGSIQNATDRLKLNFSYSTTLTSGDNNGNILSQTITVPTETRGSTTYNGFTATQTYTYDSLNRIKQATEIIIGQTSPNWRQTFDYDRYGNRSFDEGSESGSYLTTTLSRNCATSTYNPNGICHKKASNPTFSGDNRITEDQDADQQNDYLFDAAGNTTKDAYDKTFIYDGENKQVEVKNSSNQSIGQYWYDGDGKRVKKRGLINGQWEETIFVYDATGKLVAEYSNQISQTPEVGYLTNDHLGSPRINTDANGNVTARHDYLPFGEEIVRNSYGADTVTKKFTGYERDDESGLDFAQARMYNNSLGRFTTPDPVYLLIKRLSDPQQINNYAYVRNTPTKFTDPLGLDFEFNGEEKDWALSKFKENLSYAASLTVDTRNNRVAVMDSKGRILDPNNKADKKVLDTMAKSLSGAEKDLFNAIIDTKNHGVIDAFKTTNTADVGSNQSPGKNTVDRQETELYDAQAKKGGLSAADLVKHEAMEAYLTAKTGKPIDGPGGDPSPHTKNPFPGFLTYDAQLVGNSAVIEAKIMGRESAGVYLMTKTFDGGTYKGYPTGNITKVTFVPNLNTKK